MKIRFMGSDLSVKARQERAIMVDAVGGRERAEDIAGLALEFR